MQAIGATTKQFRIPAVTCTSRRAARWAGLLLLLLAGALYLLTLDDGLRVGELLGGDLITHQYAQVLGRPANAPGYPVYSMLGWLWFRIGRAVLPFFNPTQVLSLFSTLWALASLAVLYMVLLEITDQWPLAWLTAGFYAVTYFFWYYAVTTEQYASAVFQTLLFVLWAFRWQKSRSDRYLLYSALNAGFALSNLITVLFIVPGLLLFYLSQEPGLLRRRRLLAQAAVLAILPLTSYLFVYWAGRAHPDWSGIAWRGGNWFWEFLSTQQGRSELTWSFGGAPLDYPWLFLAELTPGVGLAGLAGILLLGKPRALLIYPTLIIYLLFSYIDRFGNWYQVVMPVYPLVLLGFAGLLDALLRRFPPAKRAPALWLTSAGMIALIALRLAANYPHVDQSRRPDDDAIPLARALLTDAPARGALIYGTTEEMAAVQYLTTVWGERPDVAPANTYQARQWLAGGDPRPLYVTIGAAALFQQEIGQPAAWWSAGAHLVEALRQPRWELTQPPTVPAGCFPVPGLELIGLNILPAEKDIFHAALYWRAHQPLADMTVSVRPLQAGGYLWLEGTLAAQDHPPAWNAYPFSRWRAGEVVRDDYVIRLPAGAQVDGLEVLLYQPGSAGELGKCRLNLPRQASAGPR